MLTRCNPKASTKAVIKKIRNYYAKDPKRWVTGTFNNDKGGYCLLGAVNACAGRYDGAAGSEGVQLGMRIKEALRDVLPEGSSGVMIFNDCHATFEDVLKLLDRVIENAEVKS